MSRFNEAGILHSICNNFIGTILMDRHCQTGGLACRAYLCTPLLIVSASALG